GRVGLEVNPSQYNKDGQGGNCNLRKAGRASQGESLLDVGAHRLSTADQPRHQTESEQRQRLFTLVAGGTSQFESLVGQGGHLREGTPRTDVAHALEVAQPAAQARRKVVSSISRSLQPDLCLDPPRRHRPEVPKGHHDPCERVRLALIPAPGQGTPEVVLLLAQPGEPVDLLRTQ